MAATDQLNTVVVVPRGRDEPQWQGTPQAAETLYLLTAGGKPFNKSVALRLRTRSGLDRHAAAERHAIPAYGEWTADQTAAVAMGLRPAANLAGRPGSDQYQDIPGRRRAGKTLAVGL